MHRRTRAQAACVRAPALAWIMALAVAAPLVGSACKSGGRKTAAPATAETAPTPEEGAKPGPFVFAASKPLDIHPPSGGESLVVHGVLHLDAAQIAAMGGEPLVESDAHEREDDLEALSEDEEAKGDEPKAGSFHGAAEGAEAAAPAAPAAGWKVDAKIGEPSDTCIAVSGSHVAVFSGGQVAFLNKEGKTLWHAPVSRFFAPLYRAAASTDPVVGGIYHTNDVRLSYDTYHHRFWLFANQCGNPHKDKTKYCKNVGVVAVSASEDPFAGWNLYYWHEHEFESGSPCHSEMAGSDFPMLGAGPDAMMLAIAANGLAAAPAGTKDPNGNPKYFVSHAPKFQSIMLLPSAAMAKGELASGWKYCDKEHPRVIPVTSHGPTPASRSYGVAHRSKEVDVIGWEHVFTSQQTMRTGVASVHPFARPRTAPQPNGVGLMTNVGSTFLSAVSRGDRLYASIMEYDGSVDVARVIGVDLRHFPDLEPKAVVLDQRLGRAPDYLTYPALDVNEQGAIAVGYSRSGAKTFPGVEYAVLRPGTKGFGAGMLLKAGEGSLRGKDRKGLGMTTRWGDIMGAALDPRDETAIWLAQTYANGSGGSELWVARVLGP